MEKVVEINGVKLKVDSSKAKTVSEYKVGDSVKVLMPSYDGYNVHHGTIIGFTDFKTLPTIEILYIRDNYTSADVNFLAFNEKTTDIEIVPCHEYELNFSAGELLSKIDRQITQKEEEVRNLKSRREAFLRYFVNKGI